MKKTIRMLIYVLIVMSIMLAAAGCAPAATTTAPEATTAPQETTAPAAEQKLTFWVNARDSFIGPNEQQLPQDQWYISQAIARFEAANPGVTIELVPQADAYGAHQLYRTAALAGNAPDVANLWAGTFTFPLADVLTPLNDLIPQADKENISGFNTDTLDFKEGNPILGYPTPDNQVVTFIYNKKIIQEAGLDWEANPPRTMEAFYADLEKIKSAGFTPIGADETLDGYAYYFWQIIVYWWVQQNGIDPILAEDRGEAKFADDQALLTALNTYHDLWAKGYMNQDADTSSDSWSKFLNGEIATMPRVNSFIKDAQNALGEENVGVIIPPDISADAKIKGGTIGGPGQDLVVALNSKYPETAVKFISFLNSKAEVLELNKFQTKVPVRLDVTPAELGFGPDSIGAKLVEFSKNYIFWVDNSLSPPVVSEFNPQLPLVLTGKMTPEELAARLDEVKGTQ